MSEDAPYIPIALAYIERNGMVLLSRRSRDTHQGGYWEFPGGKVQAGESCPDAVRREVLEEVGVTVTVGEELAVVRHCYSDVCVELHLFRCRIERGEPIPRQVDDVRFVSVDRLDQYAFPAANAKLLSALAAVRAEKPNQQF